MLRFTLALALCAAVSTAQQCNSEFGNYLECIDDHINNKNDPLTIEREFRKDYKEILKECFDENQGGDRCTWPDRRIDETTDPDWVFGNRGPLRGCRVCQTIARAVMAILKRASDDTLTCVRKVVSEEIRNLLRPCIADKHPGFLMPQLPDFERGVAVHKDEMAETVATFVMSVNRQRLCETNGQRVNGPHTEKVNGICNALRQRQAEQAQSNSNGNGWGNGRRRRTIAELEKTQQCIAEGQLSAFNRIMWPTHCSIRRQCVNSVPSSCRAEFAAVEGTACACVAAETQDARDVIQNTYRDFEAVAAVEEGDAELQGASVTDYRRQQCRNIAQGVIDYYTNERGIDVRGVFTKATGCASGLNDATRRKFSLDNLIGMGCNMFAREAPCLTKDLAQAIRLGVDMLEALVQRVTRFCPQQFCQV